MTSSANGWTIDDGTNNWGGSTISWHNITVNYDPFISASVDVVNNTGLTQIYTFIVTSPGVLSIPGGSRMGGSVQGGITDANFNGVGGVSTVGPGSALYFGRIDGANVLSLLPDLTTIPVRFAGDSNSTNTSAGLPGPTIPGPSVSSSIGIEHQFSLSAGDRATFTSFFVVEPVPEPASLSLLAVGALLMLRRRR